MMKFTPDDLCPSEKTLNFIRMLAYSYRVVKVNGKVEPFCLN